MAPVRLLSGVLLPLCALDCCLAAGAHVVLGNPVNFSETGGCKADDDGRGKLWRIGTSSNRLVAEMERGDWTPAPEYRDRVSPGASVGFNRTLYTDTGTYALECGSREVNIQLSVLVGFDVQLTGQTVTFPCYASAASEDTVRWDRTGTTVLEHRLSTGETTVGAGFEGRVHLAAAGGSGDGDWSLLMTQIQPGDEGDYFCSVRRDGVREAWGEPAAVRARHPRTTTHAPATTSPTVSRTEPPWAFVATVVLATVVLTAVVVGPVCLLVGWCIRSRN